MLINFAHDWQALQMPASLREVKNTSRNPFGKHFGELVDDLFYKIIYLNPPS